jgi:hypothetical protein
MEVSDLSLSGHFTPGERAHGTHWMGWVRPRAGLDEIEQKEILTLLGMEPRPCSPSLYRLSKVSHIELKINKDLSPIWVLTLYQTETDRISKYAFFPALSRKLNDFHSTCSGQCDCKPRKGLSSSWACLDCREP